MQRLRKGVVPLVHSWPATASRGDGRPSRFAMRAACHRLSLSARGIARLPASLCKRAKARGAVCAAGWRRER
jgi:hypothetical protein